MEGRSWIHGGKRGFLYEVMNIEHQILAFFTEANCFYFSTIDEQGLLIVQTIARYGGHEIHVRSLVYNIVKVSGRH